MRYRWPCCPIEIGKLEEAEAVPYDAANEGTQFRSEQDLPVLLLLPASGWAPPVRRHSYQASLSFPGDSSELLRTASRLCGRHPAPADP
jgi:hypothetical protein